MKKFYKIDRFLESPRSIHRVLLAFIGLNITYFSLAVYYNKLKEDIWMHSYGDFVPRYEMIGNYTVRTYSIFKF
jgi:hypothetical protein